MTAATPSDARVFVLDPDKHARLFGRMFRRLGLALLVALSLVQLFWWSSLSGAAHSGLACAVTLLGLVGFVAGGFWLVLWAASSRYRLLLGPSWVASDSSGAFREQLNREDLAHLCEGALGLVLVKHRGATFRIPRSLNGYELVRDQLLTWRPLTPHGSPHFRPWLGLVRKLAILVLGVLVVVFGGLLLGVLNMFVQVALRFAHS